MDEIFTPAFLTGFFTIIGIDIILSGDNAVVIALAARSLPEEQQKRAVFWGAGAAVVFFTRHRGGGWVGKGARVARRNYVR